MDPSLDVLIIGGGVIGLTTAYFLASEGLRVRVVDKGDLGQEASWAGAGMIVPGSPAHAKTPMDQLRALSSVRFAGLSEELRTRTGIDNGYRRCGGLVVSSQARSQHCVTDHDEWFSAGVTVQEMDESQARQFEPGIAGGLGKALFLPDLAQVRNPRHVRALAMGCQALGARLSPGVAMAPPLLVKNQRLIELGNISADRYVIATGAWTDALLSALCGRPPGIRPVRGQIALLQPGKPLIQRVIVRGLQYLVPRPDGRVLVGSTEENVGYDKRTTATAIRQLLDLAMTLVPALGEAPLERCWAGLRPGSPDGLPFIGRVPKLENVFVAAGHFRAGIQLSIGTALLLKEMILGKPTTIPAEPFSLARRF